MILSFQGNQPHQFAVVPSDGGGLVVCPGWVVGTSTSPVTCFQTRPMAVSWNSARDGWIWLAVSTDAYGAAVSASAGAGVSMPADTTHDGSVVTGVYHVPVARVRRGGVEQILAGSLQWNPPSPVTTIT